MKKLSLKNIKEINAGVKKPTGSCTFAAVSGAATGAVAGAESGALAGPFGSGGGAVIGGVAGMGGSMIQEPSCNK